MEDGFGFGVGAVEIDLEVDGPVVEFFGVDDDLFVAPEARCDLIGITVWRAAPPNKIGWKVFRCQLFFKLIPFCSLLLRMKRHKTID